MRPHEERTKSFFNFTELFLSFSNFQLYLIKLQNNSNSKTLDSRYASSVSSRFVYNFKYSRKANPNSKR